MGTIESAMLDLLKDKPYMHSNSPRPAVEDPEPPTDDDSDDEDNDPIQPSSTNDESEDEEDDPPPLMEDDDSDDEPNDDSASDENSEYSQSVMITDHHIPTQSFYQSRLDQSRNCETEHAVRPAANERDHSPASTSLTPRVKPLGRRTGN
jgi:hypothetical protein